MMKRFLLIVGILILCCIAVTACADVVVRFDMQKGSPSFSSLKLQPDGRGVVYFNLPGETPVREGYNFIGWYCKGLEMEYGLCKPGQSIAFQISKGTLTYVAQWENKNHQSSCPYLMAWTHNFPGQADIMQVDFKCIQDANHTYFAVHSWCAGKPGDGYAGFQTLNDGSHVVIMSLWDIGSMRPTIEYAPYSLKAQDFGGEGTGKQVISDYKWSEQCWYTMRIQARTSGNKTIYEQWIRPENGSWDKICAVSFPMAGCGFNCNCAFLEDFGPFSNQRRSMQLRNASLRVARTGKWQAIKVFDISNYESNLMTQYNVRYNCKADAANISALYMQIGGGGYENVIKVPKKVTLKKCEIIDQYMFQ